MTPRGVQGTRPGWPLASRPTFSGWKPSTSLAGSTASTTVWVSMWVGRGSWTRMPSTASIGVQLRDPHQQVRLGGAGWQADRLRRDAGRVGGLVLGSDIDGAGRVVTHQHDREAGPIGRPAIFSARRVRKAAATAAPSMMRAVTALPAGHPARRDRR